jgi:hypothetical protein
MAAFRTGIGGDAAVDDRDRGGRGHRRLGWGLSLPDRDFTTYFNGGTADVGPAQIAILHQNSLETYPGVIRAPLCQ